MSQSQRLDEVLYAGVPVTHLFNMTIDDVLKSFGTPSYDGYYNGGRCYAFNNEVTFIYDVDTRGIDSFLGNPKALKIDNVTLDMNRAGLVNVFGIPAYEESVYGEMDNINIYIMEYFQGYYTMRFILPSSNEKATDIWFESDR